ncbi:MAG: GTPase [Clostridia bacterium]|jgi:predicted GTPase|nr:GTPase [Clostridia bacterium]
MKQKVLIMGAAGRDFHNFNTYFKDNQNYEVVAFTATQIPDIHGRKYPAALAGELYPDGIPIYDESELEALIREHQIDQVIFAYSDVSHQDVMEKAARVMAAGADFRLMGPKTTMLKSKVPVVAVCAVRTGVGKSQTTRRIAAILQELGKRVVVVRHPMPYGDLAAQACQRFAAYEDLDKHECTIEEREEYEPHIDQGFVVYAGVDYQAILNEAEKEADVILWDGGNNDFPFYQPDVMITLVDPHRPGDELSYHPGATNLKMADIVIINKVETSSPENVEQVRANIRRANPEAVIVDAASPIFIADSEIIRGKRVLVVEDGPTLTHGNMPYGAGAIGARKYGAAELIDPRPYAVGSILDTFAKYSHLSYILPAMGYSKTQLAELEATIANVDAEVVVIGTPIDLRRVIDIKQPSVRVRYELQEIGEPTLDTLLKNKLQF